MRRDLASHYFVVYIDATFVPTRREHRVTQEAYYSILGVLPDGTREGLAIVNHPTEGAVNRQGELKALQERGVEHIDLIVSDALAGIENAVTSAFPASRLQFCVAHLLREMSALVPRKALLELYDEFCEVLSIDLESKDVNSASQYAAFLNFVERWSKRVPTFERYKKSRNALYFTFLDYSPKYRRMLYTTNWIERLNRCYKRTLSMRGAMPNASSVLFLLGSVAMQVNKTTYSYPVSVFKDWNNDLSVHSSSFRAKESPTLEE